MVFWLLLFVGAPIISGLVTPELSGDASMLDRLMLRYSSYKDDFPSSIDMSSSISDALEAEEEMLEVLKTYVNSDSLHKETKEFNGKRSDEEGRRLLHLYHDVVFLGFPLTAIDFIADKWIHLLQRDEHILSTINENENVIKMPGDIMIRNHYNLVKSSFHVADAINSRIKSLASSNNTINIWEIEEILQSLSEAIITTSVQQDENTENEIHAQAPPAAADGNIRPTSVIYILNLSNTRGLRYYYGFTDEELLEIRNKHPDLKDLSTQIVQNEKRKTRLDLDADDAEPPLQGLQLDDVRVAYGQTSSDEASSSGYLKDSLKGTRNWASKFNSEAFSSAIYSRAQRILQSTADPHRLHLAKAILNTNDLSLPSRTHCSSDTWISSSSRLMWIDLNSAKTPPINVLDGIALSTPAPRQLVDSEWLKLGELSLTSKLGASDNDNIKLLSTNIVSLQNTIVRYKDNIESFLKQARNCAISAGVLEGDFTHVVAELVKLYDVKTVSLTCGSLYLQAIFFTKILEFSSSFHRTLTNPSSSGGDERYHLRELSLLHIDLLTYAIERSNLFHESLVHGNHVSQEASMYLGHLASKILHLTRYIITPPMQLKYADVTHTTSPPTSTPKSHQTFYEIIDGLHLYESENPNMYHSFVVNENNLWLNNIMPSNLVPSRVEFVIYIIRAQKSYDPFDKNGLNYWHLMKEIEKLKLPNQQMVVSTISINSVNEEGLGIGLTLCQRSEMISKNTDDMTTTYYEYLDSSCMWTYLQHHDELNSKHNDDHYRYNQYIPIFIVSVDTVTPTYVDGTALAVGVTGGIIAVQNMQENIGTTMMCDNRLLHVNGRNPLASILTAVGGIVGGLGKSHKGHCGTPTSYTVADAMNMKYVEYGNKEKWSSRPSIYSLGTSVAVTSVTDISNDYSSFLGDSPIFDINSLSSLPSFSPLDIDFIHRSKILKSLSITTAILKYDSAASAREPINEKVQNTLQALEHFDYAAAAAYSNLAYSLIAPMAERNTESLNEPTLGSDKRNGQAARKITVTGGGFLLHYFAFPAVIMLLFFFLTVIIAKRMLQLSNLNKDRSSSGSRSRRNVDDSTEESIFKLNLPVVFGNKATGLPTHY